MKACTLSFILLSVFSLYPQSKLEYDFGISYPLGISSGIKFENQYVKSLIGAAYLNDQLLANKFFFQSDYFSLGSVMFNGLLRDLNSENFHFFSFDNINKASLNKDGNPNTNLGMIFNVPSFEMGIGAYRKEKYSQIVFWKNIDRLPEYLMNYSQSISFNDNTEENETWYVDDSYLQSFFLWNHSFSMIWGAEDLFAGGQVQLSSSLKDQPGFSTLLLMGMTLSKFNFQNELRINCPYFRTSDLDRSNYPFVLKGVVEYSDSKFSLKKIYKFYCERNILPWNNRLWELDLTSECVLERPQWKINGLVDFSIFSTLSDSFDYSLSLTGSFKRLYSSFYWEAKGQFKYYDIYEYLLWAEIGIEMTNWNLSLNSSLEIDRSVTMDFRLEGKIYYETFKIKADFSLNDFGIYNSYNIEIKPSFFLGIEMNLIPNSKEQSTSQLLP